MKILLFCLISLNLYAASNNGVWFGTFANSNLDSKNSFYFETQLRRNTDNGKMAQVLYRTGLLHTYNPDHQFGYLYGFIQSETLKEDRHTLQHAQNYAIEKISLSHRARLEYRTLENTDNDSVRFRYLIRAEQFTFTEYPIVMWDEVFVNLTREDWTGDRDFERNRFFIGLKKIISNKRLEFGYLNQYVPRDGEDSTEHLLVGYIFI